MVYCPFDSQVPALGVLEGDILRLLWDASEPQSSVQVYEAMYFSRRAEKREMQSPSTIAVTLSRMVEKGLLNVERKPRGARATTNLPKHGARWWARLWTMWRAALQVRPSGSCCRS